MERRPLARASIRRRDGSESPAHLIEYPYNHGSAALCGARLPIESERRTRWYSDRPECRNCARIAGDRPRLGGAA